jgi:hypothetical protein
MGMSRSWEMVSLEHLNKDKLRADTLLQRRMP